MPLEVAQDRLRLQLQVGQLNESLRSHNPSSFAGIYVDHRPEDQVVAMFTNGGNESIDAEQVDSSLAPSLQIREVLFSLADLEREQHRLATSLGRQASVDIDLRANRVRVEVVEEAAFHEVTAILSESAYGVVVPELPSPAVNLFGGLASSTCTSGFTIYYGTNTTNRGIATAGHCPNSQSYSGNALTYQNDGTWTGNYDAQSHKLSGATYQNLVFDGQLPNPLTRPITGRVYWVNQSVGDFVCKYGKVTHWGCGFIVSTSNPGCASVPGTRYIKVDSDVDGPGFDLAESGDSGGPWFYGNNAYGIMSCQQGFDGIYETVGYIEVGLGAKVLTAP